MDSIENDIDFIITKTHRLQAIIDNEDYHLLESKELVRQRLIQQFFDDYKPEEIIQVTEKLELVVSLSEHISKQCEDIYEGTKQDILKLKKSDSIKKAYK